MNLNLKVKATTPAYKVDLSKCPMATCTASAGPGTNLAFCQKSTWGLNQRNHASGLRNPGGLGIDICFQTFGSAKVIAWTGIRVWYEAEDAAQLGFLSWSQATRMREQRAFV